VTTHGIQLATRLGFKNCVGAKAGDSYVRRYCAKKGITPPWDVQLNSYIIAKEDKALLDRARSGMANPGAGTSTSGWTAINSTSGNPTTGSLEFKSLGDKLAALERRIEGLQTPNTGGRSLDAIFTKLEALETRVAKVDVLSEKMDKTTAILDALCVKVGL
jgi:hypothetical protein